MGIKGWQGVLSLLHLLPTWKFLPPVPMTLSSACLEVFVPKERMLPLEDTPVVPLN